MKPSSPGRAAFLCRGQPCAGRSEGDRPCAWQGPLWNSRTNRVASTQSKTLCNHEKLHWLVAKAPTGFQVFFHTSVRVLLTRALPFFFHCGRAFELTKGCLAERACSKCKPSQQPFVVGIHPMTLRRGCRLVIGVGPAPYPHF